MIRYWWHSAALLHSLVGWARQPLIRAIDNTEVTVLGSSTVGACTGAYNARVSPPIHIERDAATVSLGSLPPPVWGKKGGRPAAAWADCRNAWCSERPGARSSCSRGARGPALTCYCPSLGGGRASTSPTGCRQFSKTRHARDHATALLHPRTTSCVASVVSAGLELLLQVSGVAKATRMDRGPTGDDADATVRHRPPSAGRGGCGDHGPHVSRLRFPGVWKPHHTKVRPRVPTA